MPQEQQRPTKGTLGETFNGLNLAVTVYMAAITPFFRRRFGSEAFFPAALFTFGVLLLLTGSRWRNGMGVYLILWLAMMACHRTATLVRSYRGVVTHSRYGGDPWLAMRFWFIKSDEQGRAFEPVLCLVLGAALCLVSPTVGLFVMGGFVAFSLKLVIDRFVVYRRVQQMHDAQIEGEYYAEEFKKGR